MLEKWRAPLPSEFLNPLGVNQRIYSPSKFLETRAKRFASFCDSIRFLSKCRPRKGLNFDGDRRARLAAEFCSGLGACGGVFAGAYTHLCSLLTDRDLSAQIKKEKSDMRVYLGSDIRNVAVVGPCALRKRPPLISALLHAAKMTTTRGRVGRRICPSRLMTKKRFARRDDDVECGGVCRVGTASRSI